VIDVQDLGLLASEWLRIGNPYDPNYVSY